MNKKVIITDYLHAYLLQRLVALGFDVDVMEEITNEQLHGIIHQYAGLVINTKIRVTPQLLDKAVALKFIARAGSGMDNIDTEYAKSKNIYIVNSPEGNANAVAEHTLGMLLSLLNKLNKSDREIRNGVWQREKNRGVELDGKIVGIIGFGNTGSAFAKKLRGFNVKILACDKYKSGFGDEYVEECLPEKIQQEADVISFHVPLTNETYHYLNNAYIDGCLKDFWVINTSRGKVVNTSHLLEALQSGRIKGAALDVFENENYSELSGNDFIQMGKLKEMDNTILTPHVAGWTVESYYKISLILAEKIELLHLFA